MPIAEGYQQFGGLHWETSTVGNVLAHYGVTAPHTGKPLSEAMLLGVSGGIGLMYFVFEYEGWEPTYFVNTRYVKPKTDTFAELCQRLGVEAKIQTAANPVKAEANLVAALKAGRPAIVWADKHTLPYNALKATPGLGWMMPIVVYGYEGDTVQIADRSAEPLSCPPGALSEARAALANTKFRMATLTPPAGLGTLPDAVLAGIRACVATFTDPPMSNFGLPSFTKWADLLTSAKDPKGWPRLFHTPARLYSNLKLTYEYLALEGTGGGATRPLYADFLDEAAVVLGKPGLKEAAGMFRAVGQQWVALAEAALPGPLAETAQLMARRDRIFREQGLGALPEMQQIGARLAAIQAGVAAEFPLSPAEVNALRQELRERLLALLEAERTALTALAEVI